MTQFTTRMVLHGADREEYITLHAEMEKRGFSRTITADSGKVYHLPDAEYDFSGNVTRDHVRNLAMAAAKAAAPRRRAASLVTQANGRTWTGLDEVTHRRVA
ncbi:MAG: type V toxin-antitoxin system endoribonuclease antitoxin GhoS [Candidatus Andeanibacterium colombiense]|uniref:Type V toxin-antitoxin system endoribonuclease antitoxin GhoS n=1 Tax=Candidatus Andeanibacterium colombiense TaxID=3121345 RepID=A0AAJ5X6A7_9SPHN|nr:MAG: type V toxin-antitoxin system endoribonuclease antitoxin GhoS [Sphingomonadaceae bacterium]